MAHHPFPWTEAFLAALREWPVLSHAARAVGIDRSTAWRAMQADKVFASAVEDAMEEGVDRAELEAMRRGVVGYEEPVVYQGQLTPVWARDADGNLVTEEFEMGSVYPKDHPKAGQPIMGTRPVQARDANGQPVWLTVRKHSDALLGLVLKARRKSYGTERTELTSPDGSMSPVDETSRAARVAQILAAARERKQAEDNFDDLA